MKILAIESSCDETAAAVVVNGTKIISNVVATSHEMHEKYGGIVPEVAAREQLKCILPTITEALKVVASGKLSQVIADQIDAIAVTHGPGLIGSLLVGVEAAKTLSLVTSKPLIPVNHVLAHMYANFLESSQENSSRVLSRDNNTSFPAISLVVSGGHTELFLLQSETKLKWLGGTLDDAAGEAFDKTARLLGFGAGGGITIQESAKNFTAQKSQPRIKLPRPMLGDGTLNFSFSGLKTAILREVNKLKESQQFNNLTIQQLSYEVQETITDVLVTKTLTAAAQYDAASILLSGGVASNLRLRDKFNASDTSSKIIVPPVPLCTDNAAYIAAYAFFRGKPVDWHEVTAIPDLSVEVNF